MSFFAKIRYTDDKESEQAMFNDAIPTDLSILLLENDDNSSNAVCVSQRERSIVDANGM